MKRVHIVGGKNHGKTTLITDLLKELSQRGLKVGTIKHTHHRHELDVTGKDSYRHRESGAVVVGILSRDMNALFWPGPEPQDGEQQTSHDDRYQQFTTAFADCDVVLVEGDTRTSAPKLEVWRAQFDAPPMADQLPNVHAVISDDELPLSYKNLPRSNIDAIVEFLLGLVCDPTDAA